MTEPLAADSPNTLPFIKSHQEPRTPTGTLNLRKQKKRTKQQTPKVPKPFKDAPAKEQADLIMHYPARTKIELAENYREAATRLGSTFTASASDDPILQPFLFLYRHAFELYLKGAVQELAFLRKDRAGHLESTIDPHTDDYFQDHIVHDLDLSYKLYVKHYNSCSPVDEIPRSIATMIQALHEMDAAGTAFRYPNANRVHITDRETGDKHLRTERIAFTQLHQDLDKEFNLFATVHCILRDELQQMPSVEDYY